MNIVPFSEEQEKAVIVSILSDPHLLPKITSIITFEDFYKVKHQEIFKEMEKLEPDNLDSITLKDKLKPETADYLNELVQDSDKILPSISNAFFYAETIKQKSKLRAGIDLGQQIIATCYSESDADEAIQTLEDMFATFLQKRVLENREESALGAFKKFVEALSTRTPDDPDAVKSGFMEVDLIIQRMEGLIVLAARPGMGKTALAVNIMRNVLKQDLPVVCFSLEQSTEQIFERMLAAEAEIPLEDIRLGLYRNDEVAQASVEKAENKLEHLLPNFHIDDAADIDASYMKSVARQKYFEWGKLGLIVVDYLHIMRLGEGNPVDTLGAATKELRALGKELDCPVLLLAQLNRSTEGREAKKNRRPELSDLRSSGEIEQSADMVWFIYRDSYYDQPGLLPDTDVAELIVRKNRNGRQGFVELEWYPTIVKFKDINRLGRNV